MLNKTPHKRLIGFNKAHKKYTICRFVIKLELAKLNFPTTYNLFLN